MMRGIVRITNSGTVDIPPEPVWMTQYEIADLLGVFPYDVRKAIRSIYKNGELRENDTSKYIRQPDGISLDTYNIEMVIALSFKIYSKESIIIRRQIIGKLCLKCKRESDVLIVLAHNKAITN